MAKSKKQKKKMEGLGDAVAAVTSALGIDYLVKKIFTENGIDCGCEERRQRWNKAFPFRKPYDCLTKDEFLELDQLMTNPPTVITNIHQKTLRTISDRIYRERTEMSGCGVCVRELWDRMKAVWENYKEDEKESQSH